MCGRHEFEGKLKYCKCIKLIMNSDNESDVNIILSHNIKNNNQHCNYTAKATRCTLTLHPVSSKLISETKSPLVYHCK